MLKGEIYYADLGKPFGSEQGGRRLICIVQNNMGNLYSTTTIVCPLTTKLKPKLPTHILIEEGTPKKSLILCEQIMVIDKKRILSKTPIYTLNDKELRDLNRALKISLEIYE